MAPTAAVVRMVCARSRAEMPVVTPCRASMLTVKAVPRTDWLSGVIIGKRSASTDEKTSLNAALRDFAVEA